MKRNTTLQIALVVSLGGFLFGFDASVISGVIRFIQPQFGLTDIQLGWVVGSPTFAAMFAMLSSGTISDYVGRKKVLIYAALLYSVSAFLSALAPSYEVLVIARMIGGFAFGAALVLAPIYIAEISPEEKRGKLVSVQQFNIVIGFSVSYFSNYLLQTQYSNGNWGLIETNVWRWMLGIEFIPAIAYFFLMFFVPRSPRWLIMKGIHEEAERVLNRLFDKKHIKIIKDEMSQSLKEKRAKAKLSDLFDPRLKLVLSIGLVVGVIQQVTGVNAIYFYAPTIFEQSGVGTNAAFAQAVWVGIINVVFTIVAMLLIDKIGRKPLLMMGLIGVIISMAITSYGFSKATYTIEKQSIESLTPDIGASLSKIVGITYESDIAFKKALKASLGEEAFSSIEGRMIEQAIEINPIIVLVGILLFVASFAISLGPVMWVLLSEIFPNRIRGLLIAIVGFVNSTTSFIVQLLFPWELSNLGNVWTFGFFGLFAIVGLAVLYKILPETKGKSLEQIEKEIAS